MVNPLLFGLAYLASWLMMGLGAFLFFRVVIELGRGAERSSVLSEASATQGGLARTMMLALALAASLGIAAGGAYTLIRLFLAA